MCFLPIYHFVFQYTSFMWLWFDILTITIQAIFQTQSSRYLVYVRYRSLGPGWYNCCGICSSSSACPFPAILSPKLSKQHQWLAWILVKKGKCVIGKQMKKVRQHSVTLPVFIYTAYMPCITLLAWPIKISLSILRFLCNQMHLHKVSEFWYQKLNVGGT